MESSTAHFFSVEAIGLLITALLLIRFEGHQEPPSKGRLQKPGQANQWNLDREPCSSE